jgi:ribonuclease III
MQTIPDLADLEARLGVQFSDRSLLLTSLTHRSYLNENPSADTGHNERLEFLGDAVLDYLAGTTLYEALPAAREGELTAARAVLVCEPALAHIARRLGLGQALRLGKGEDASGGRERPSLLGDAFEALVGALYLDAGMEQARAFVIPLFADELDRILAGRGLKDAKSRLQELSQGRWQITPRYVTVADEGPDHAKTFVVEARVGDRAWGTGRGASKAAAASRAAREAIERIADESGSDSPQP